MMSLKIIRNTIFILILISFSLTLQAGTRIQAECLSSSGKMKKCAVQSDGSMIQIDFRSSKYQDRRINGRKIRKITGGEYSRRRVMEAILFSPWILFSKKKRDTFGIEYINHDGKRDSAFIQVHKKYGLGMKTLLESVSGKRVYLEAPRTKKKKGS